MIHIIHTMYLVNNFYNMHIQEIITNMKSCTWFIYMYIPIREGQTVLVSRSASCRTSLGICPFSISWQYFQFCKRKAVLVGTLCVDYIVCFGIIYGTTHYTYMLTSPPMICHWQSWWSPHMCIIPVNQCTHSFSKCFHRAKFACYHVIIKFMFLGTL